MISEAEVIEYITEKCKGVTADASGIKTRYDNYVQFKFASGLVEYIQSYLKKEDKVLDIGSGFGSFVFLLREKGYDAYGIEISDFLVEYARQRFQRLLNVSSEFSSSIYIKDSALNIPFQDEVFNCITIWNVLEHVSDYKTVLQEAMRVLKPGGKLFIMNVNYASCFIEPHYRVPWIPYLPKSFAAFYLKLIGRDPHYLNNGIFYVHNLGIINTINRNGLHITTSKLEKTSHASPVIISKYKRFIWNLINLLGLRRVMRCFLKAQIYNPFWGYTNIIAEKKPLSKQNSNT